MLKVFWGAKSHPRSCFVRSLVLLVGRQPWLARLLRLRSGTMKRSSLLPGPARDSGQMHLLLVLASLASLAALIRACT